MTPYYYVYGFTMICLLMGIFFGQLRIAALIAVIPMFVMVIGRGMVGVDTSFYVFLIDTIKEQGWLAVAIEPGFTIPTEFMTQLSFDSLNILLIYGGIVTVIMVAAGLKLERDPVFFFALILPYFLFDMAMNGIRYGMAFAIVTLATVFLMEKKRAVFVILCVLAVSIQITSLMLAVGIWTLVERRIRTFLIVFALVSLFSIYFGSYVFDKATSNVDLLPPSSLSGIVPLALTIMVLGIATMTGEPYLENKVPLAVLIGCAVGSFLISRSFYAGLRIQSLVLYLSYLYVACIIYPHREIFRWSSRTQLVIIVLALVSSAARLKNFSDDQNVGDSPFAPYYFDRDIK